MKKMKKICSLIAIFVMILTAGIVMFACNNKQTYNITVEECQHGTINIVESAVEGKDVYFEAVPEPDYSLKKITVNNQEITGDHFTMPARDVVIRATFDKKYSFAISQVSNGKILASIDRNYAFAGETIILTFEPEENCYLDYFTINENKTYTSNNSYSFQMPEENVTISAIFKRDGLIGSFNATNMENLNGNYSFTEDQYINNFIHFDGDKCTLGFYKDDRYSVASVDYSKDENDKILLNIPGIDSSNLNITFENGSIIVNYDGRIKLTYQKFEDLNFSYGEYTSTFEYEGHPVTCQSILQKNGNIIFAANANPSAGFSKGYDYGQLKLYGNIFLIENVFYDVSSNDVHVGKITKQGNSYVWNCCQYVQNDQTGAFSCNSYNITFNYVGEFDETVKTYIIKNKENSYDKYNFIQIMGNLVSIGAYIYQEDETLGICDGYFYYEYLPYTKEGNVLKTSIYLPFSNIPITYEVSATLNESGDELTLDFMNDNHLVYKFTPELEIENISGTYVRNEIAESKTVTDEFDENGNIVETITYSDSDSFGPNYLGRIKIYGNLMILSPCKDMEGIGYFVGFLTINDAFIWNGQSFYIDNGEISSDEFNYVYTKNN